MLLSSVVTDENASQNVMWMQNKTLHGMEIFHRMEMLHRREMLHRVRFVKVGYNAVQVELVVVHNPAPHA